MQAITDITRSRSSTREQARLGLRIGLQLKVTYQRDLMPSYLAGGVAKHHKAVLHVDDSAARMTRLFGNSLRKSYLLTKSQGIFLCENPDQCNHEDHPSIINLLLDNYSLDNYFRFSMSNNS
eukprot:767064-Hanusia_phi.AAC.4